MRVRPPEWRPDGLLADATWRALDWWYERNRRLKRPEGAEHDAEFLAYAWTLQDLNSEQIRYVAGSVLTRSKGNFPDHRELELEIDELRAERARRDALKADAAKPKARWNGDELAGCPTCGTLPRYSVQHGAQHAAWVFTSPDCGCCGWMATTMHSLHLRGVVANTEDNPVELAKLYRSSAEGLITSWRTSGRRLADVLRDAQAVA